MLPFLLPPEELELLEEGLLPDEEAPVAPFWPLADGKVIVTLVKIVDTSDVALSTSSRVV